MVLNCSFVPPYLLARIAEARPGQAPFWRACLERDAELRGRRPGPPAAPPAPAARPRGRPAEATPSAPAWVVHTAENTASLPGRPVRSAGKPESGDPAVDEAAYGVEGSLALFADVYSRESYDAAGITVSATVHFEQDYANAFWDGSQLVFGDGDGEIFGRFTRAVDVLGHEFTHAVVEHTAGLVYQGQPGALNESVSDVFAACLVQRLLGRTAEEADWLIGADLFLPGVSARALRDMANPGTAYDDPVLGSDPQPAHMDDYIETDEDNGGVHLNSGIPNRAFHLAATAIGGSSAEGAGRIWYDALAGDRVGPSTDFAEFAAATVAAAGAHADLVAEAWGTVGVAVDAGGGSPAPTPPEGPRQVQVRRSGGFAGFTVDARVDLESDDDRAGELAELAQRIDLAAVPQEPPQPDRYVYHFDLCGRTADVPEQCLTVELRRVVDLVLARR